MRTSFSLKEAAAILGVHERRVTQSLDPAVIKLAKLWRADPTRTMKLLMETVERLAPMDASELHMRQLMQTCKLDRQQLHPTTNP